MVNYCCVQNCGRNSRLNKHLNFYSLPKERNRQVQWLTAAGRADLLMKDLAKLSASSYRFCSRHFPASSIKHNRNLITDAVPTVCLPGSMDDGDSSDNDPLTHSNIVCNNCSEPIVGFRYKCVTCTDYDLCQKCEKLEAHPIHYMLRIPKPLKFKHAETLTSQWRKFFKAKHVVPSADSDIEIDSTSSDDDVPITQYAKNYDSGVDLSEDVKEMIRKEVSRVAKLKPPEQTAKQTSTKRQTDDDTAVVPNKQMKYKEEDQTYPEVVFADVNADPMDMKPPSFPMMTPQVNNPVVEGNPSAMVLSATSDNSSMVLPATSDNGDMVPAQEAPIPQPGAVPQPVMHVKLSDDLSELMIEVTSTNNQKIVYKYS